MPGPVQKIEDAIASLSAVAPHVAVDPVLWTASLTLSSAILHLKSNLYAISVESIEPGMPDDIIGGWVAPDAGYGQMVRVKYALTNRSNAPISGRIAALFDGLLMQPPADASRFDNLPPGGQFEGTAHCNQWAGGVHLISIQVLPPQPQPLVQFDPSTGKPVERSNDTPISILTFPFISGSRDEVRSGLVNYLGIRMTSLQMEKSIPGNRGFEAVGQDSDGIGRHLEVDLYTGEPWEDQVNCTLNYWEDGAPRDTALNARVFMKHGDFYDLLPNHLIRPTVTFSIEAPVDDLAVQHGVPPAVIASLLGAVPPSVPTAPRPRYRIDPNTDRAVRGHLEFTASLNETYDGLVLSEGRYYITVLNRDPDPANTYDLASVTVPLNVQEPLPEYNLDGRFSQVLHRLAFFAGVLEDRYPTAPMRLDAMQEVAVPDRPIVQQATVDQNPVEPILTNSDWLRIVGHGTIALLVKTSCVAFFPFNWVGTAICVIGTLGGAADAIMIEKLIKASSDLAKGIHLGPPPPPNYGSQPGSTSGVAGPYPGPSTSGSGAGFPMDGGEADW